MSKVVKILRTFYDEDACGWVCEVDRRIGDENGYTYQCGMNTPEEAVAWVRSVNYEDVDDSENQVQRTVTLLNTRKLLNGRWEAEIVWSEDNQFPFWTNHGEWTEDGIVEYVKNLDYGTARFVDARVEKENNAVNQYMDGIRFLDQDDLYNDGNFLNTSSAGYAELEIIRVEPCKGWGREDFDITFRMWGMTSHADGWHDFDNSKQKVCIEATCVEHALNKLRKSFYTLTGLSKKDVNITGNTQMVDDAPLLDEEAEYIEEPILQLTYSAVLFDEYNTVLFSDPRRYEHSYDAVARGTLIFDQFVHQLDFENIKLTIMQHDSTGLPAYAIETTDFEGRFGREG